MKLYPYQEEGTPRSASAPVLDKFGQQVTPGVFVAYGDQGHGLHRGALVRVGVVREVEFCKNVWGQMVPRITVVGVDDDGLFEEARIGKMIRPDDIYFARRVIVLPLAIVPEEFMKLLEGAGGVAAHGNLTADQGGRAC
jgi:hypothetical protein